MAYLKNRFIRMARCGLDLVFPVPCISCGRPVDTAAYNGVFCRDCRPDDPVPAAVRCTHCGAPLPGADFIGSDDCYCCEMPEGRIRGIVSLGPYHEDRGLSRMILAMKHGGKTVYCREFGSRLAHRIRDVFPDEIFHGVVPVPLHRRRYWKRGYNQSALVATVLAEVLDIPCYTWLLSRIRSTPPQSGGRRQRQRNVRHAFTARGWCRDASLILVDDVVTTGATVRESAAVLYRAGAASVVAASCGWVPRIHSPDSIEEPL